jgi:hypothetical protein
MPLDSRRLSFLWVFGALTLLSGAVLYWVRLDDRALTIPPTPVARIQEMYSDQLLLLREAAKLIPEGASYTAVAFDRDAEMSLFMFSLSELLNRYPLPMSYYGLPVSEVGGRARYVVSYRCQTLEPGLKLLGKFPQGCVYERMGPH